MKDRIKDALKDRLQAVSSDPDRLKYHLMADIGWISDPNGLVEHNGIVHIFHQYTPAEDLGLHKAWGHYTTKDWKHYTDEGTLMVPDQPLDKDGCYSGSGFSWDGKMHLFYTGNILEDGDYDYINEGRGHYTNHLSSDDGIHFSEKETLLKNEDYPQNMSCHVRDPKVSLIDGKPYMVIGARTKDSKGCALLYKCNPKDLCDLEFVQVIDSDKPFGYMWECPGLIEDGKDLYLLCCPQGVDQEGYRYENVYQNGLFALKKDEKNQYEAKDFQELDLGFDFYAPQSFTDSKGREIVIGWMGIPDADYEQKEKCRNWIHALTLPRELSFKNGKVFQYPIEEIVQLKENAEEIELKADQPVELRSRVFMLDLNVNNQPFELKLRHDAKLTWDGKLFTLSFEESGAGRKARHVETDSLNEISIFSDESSLEIFLNHGEYAFSSRVYDQDQEISLESSIDMNGVLADVQSFEIDYEPALKK